MLRSSFFISALTAVSLFALPSGHKIKHGKVQITQSEKKMIIQSGKRAVVNWDKFSIDKGETARFQMKDSKSSVLNRVTGNARSDILGNLESNGKVYLLNQKGILFGKDCQVNVGGLVASTLDVLDEEFLRGFEMRFFGDEKGSIVNLGEIEGNSIFLLANKVENHGTIKAKRVGLATGSKILLQPKGEQRIFIEASNSEEAIDNRGKIEALTTEIRNSSPYVLAVQSSGTIGTVCAENREGKIFLVADNGTVDVEGKMRANQIKISAEEILVNGPVDVSTKDVGGKVFLHGTKSVNIYGDINARGKIHGGYVEICSDNAPGLYSFIDRRAENGPDGLLFIDPKNAFIDPLGLDSASGQSFAFMSGANQSIPGSAVATALIGGPLTIQCNTDCVIRDTITSASANTFTIQCGRTCAIDPGFALSFAGDFNVEINDLNAIAINRDAGLAVFDMQTGSSITLSGTASFTQSVGTFGAVQEGIVTLSNAAITGAGGNITLEGRNQPTATLAMNYGVDITSTSSLATTGSGNITITGLGGGGTGQNIGVLIDGISTITVDAGLLTVNGTGGPATGNNNVGVRLGQADLTSTSGVSGALGIEVIGQAGTGVFGNKGMQCLFDGDLLSNAGPITISGTGDSTTTGFLNEGVDLGGSSSVISTSGAITITGTGGGGTNLCTGVTIRDTVTSELGDILITGTGGAVGSNNRGIFNNGTVESTGTVKGTAGTISLVGNGSANAGNTGANGILLATGTVTSVAGNVSLNGTAAGTAANGISTSGVCTISSTGIGANSADMDFVGEGATGNGFALIPGSTMSTIDGNITITGTGSVTGTIGATVQAILQSTGSGTIDITGTAFGNDGFTALQMGTLITSSDGKITITGFGDGTNFSGIVVEMVAVISGTSSADVELIGTGGAPGGDGVFVSGPGSSVSTEVGTLTITGTGGGVGSNARGIEVTSAGNISTASGIMNMTGKGAIGTLSNTGIAVDGGGSTITSTTGTLNLDGEGRGSGISNYGISLTSGGNISLTGTGTATIDGQGSTAGSSDGVGIRVVDAGTAITNAASGVMNINGTGGGTAAATGNHGVLISTSGEVTDSSGTVTITGLSANALSNNIGISMIGSGNAETDAGSLTLTGTGRGSSNDNYGIGIVGLSTVASANAGTGTGTLVLTGQGGNGTTLNRGIYVESSTISNIDGTTTLMGTAGSGTSQNDGIFLDSSAAVQSTGLGAISLTGTGVGSSTQNRGIALDNSSEVTSLGTGTVTLLGTGGNTAGDSWGINLLNLSGVRSLTGAITATGIAGAGTQEGIELTSFGEFFSSSSATIDVTTMSDLDLLAGGQILGGSALITVTVARDINITGSAVDTGIFPGTGGVTVSAGRDITLTGTSTGSAQIGNATGAGTTSDITFTNIGRNLLVDGGSLSGAATSGFAVIGHGQVGATSSGNILFTNVVGNVTVVGANVGAGTNGFGQIGHVALGGTTLNGNIDMTVRGSIIVTGGTVGATANARIGIGGPAASTTTQSRMALISNNNITISSPGAGQGIVSNPSTVFNQGQLTLVVDNINPAFPNFGAGTFNLLAGSDLSTTNGELRIYTVQPTQVTIVPTVNGTAYVPTAFNVDNATNQYNTYHPGGTFVGGAAFRVYYKTGSGVMEAMTLPFVENKFYCLGTDEAQLQDGLPIFRYMRLPNYPWHHPSFCDAKDTCDPGFDPYHSLNFRDNIYWIGESSSDVL